MGLIKRERSPSQETWIAMQRVIAATIRRRVVQDGEPLTTALEADFLADHITDDLMGLHPLVPAEHWVPQDGE